MSAIENQTKNLRTYIEKIATKILENKVVSSVITGTISSIEGQSYVIKLSGSNTEINAIPIDKKQIYKVNDYVYMISFIDGTDTVYRIYDTVDKTYEEFYNLTTDERFSDEDGKLFFDNFASSPSALNYVLGQDTENEGKYIDKIKESGCFKIEGCFGSSENTSQDFGLKILFYEEAAVSAFKTEYLNPPYFLGQPHNLSQAVSQSRVITLSETDKQKLNYIVIQTFGEGFVYSNIKLTCGILLNVESLFTTTLTIENNKNYFSPDEYQDSISLKAEVSQDGRKLTSDSLSYYWLLKDNNFNDKDSSQYLDIAGDGWRCINTFSIENKVSPDGSSLIPTKIWHKSESKLVLNESQIDKGIAETSGFLFSNFSNELKCLVTYKDVKVSSRTVTINNYYKEQFFAELYASVNPATIINSEDSFTLTCEVKNENNKINLNNYEYKYTWYKKSDSENIDITPKDSNGNILTDVFVLTVRGSKDAATAGEKVYEIQDSHEIIYCEVTVLSKDKNENGDFIFISKENSNEQEISSVLKDSSIDITSTKEFKYYISENNMSVSFDQMTEKQEEGSSSIWNGDWEIYDKELKNREWTDLIVDNEQEAYLKIFGEDYTIFTDAMKQSENIYYVYYTERTLWKQDLSGSISTIRTENWQQPTLTRAVVYKGNSIWENLKTGQAIEQINTFNQLTNYGKEEGIFYADELYIVTNDEIKDDSKTYYIKQNNEYIKFMGTSFINNITYYEKVSTTTGKKLYINANYINTGALRVGSENNEKFYADIDNDNVKIAGFVVDKNSLSSGQEDTDEYVYLGTDGLKVGNFLQAGPNGAAISGSVTFTGENGASSTFNELQQQIIIYGERKNLVVYSLSETKPKIKPYLSKDGDTNIGEFASENTTWFTSYDASKVIWMCQKYDNSLVDNNEIPWGDIIQIAAAKSYSIEIDNDFIAIPTAAGGELDSNWNEIINVSIKKGFETYSLPNNIGPGAPIGDEEKLGYEVSNVTVTYIPEDKNFKITNLTKDTGKIWFKFYKFGQLQATATVELVKQKSGSSGGVPTIGQDGYWYIDGNKTDVLAKGQDGSDGETPEIKNGYWYIGDVSLGVKAEGVDGEYSYIQTDIGSIKKDVGSGNLLTQSIVINAYKKIGSQPPVSDTKKYYVGVKIDEKQAITWLESLVLLKDYTYTIPEVPTKKLTLYFNPDSKNSGVDYGLIDKIVLNVIQDGQDGQSGRSVGNIEEYYRISNEDNSDNTYEYSTSVPAFTAQDLEKGRICIWNYEITLDAEGEEISQTNAVLLFKYAFDGTDGLNGKDGTDGLNGKDGISIQSITEYYKLYAEAQDFAEAPSIEELDEEWTDSADSLTSGDKPFKYNCEVITFDRDRDPIITMPQLVAEHPKTVHFIYSSSSTKPETPNPGIPAEGWTTTLESDTKWKCEKVDYSISGSVTWSKPYQIVAADGVSPYLLSIDNDFIAIPCDSEGQLIDKDFSEIFNVSIYQGDKIYNLTNNEKIKVSFINGFSVDITEGNNYKYTLTNFVFEEEKDRGTILVELIRDESIILASSTIEIIKQKQGDKGSTGDTGEAGSYVYALANTNTISVNENGKLKSADGIETISIGVYKRSGGNAPSFDKDNYYAVSFKNNQGNEHLYRGRKANSENAFTCKIGDKNSNNGVQLQTPTLNLTISIYQVSAYNESLMNNPNAILIDKIVLNVVKDGATGSQGAAAPTLQIVYKAATTTPATPTENEYPPSDWHVSEPALADGERLYMSQKMSDEDESAWSVPIPISALDGTAGKDGSDIKYIYRRSATPLSGNDLTPGGSGGDVNLPSNWTDSPQGVTEEYLYEYVSISSKPAGDEDWSSYSTAVIWSKWGEKGQDGDGIEYRYRVFTNIQNFQTALTDEEIVDWTDEPIGVNESNKYEYICQRKYDGATQTYTNSIPKLWNEWKEVEVPEAIPGRNPLQSVFYYTWSTNKNDATKIDISGLYPSSESYFRWGVDDNNKKTIKFGTPTSWIKSDGHIIGKYWNWALEKDFFKHWSGTECSVRSITADSNLGSSTFVWKIQVTAYDDETIGLWAEPVLVPELEAIELAAKYQIKDNIYVNGFFNNDNLTYPLLGDTSDGNEYDAEESITGLTALTPFIKVPEGDIGRWCRLYERTVISGGAILTGSITADKIKVNDLSALQANIGGWTISQDALISSNKWIQLISNNTLPYQDDYACIIAGKKWLISSPEEIKVYYIIGEDDSLTDVITHDSAYFNSDKGDTIVEFNYNDQGQAVLYKNNNSEYPGLVDYEDEYVYQGIVTMNNRQYNSWKIVAENHECRGWGILTNVIIDNTFVLTQSGELYASKANISGTIYATLGTIGLFEITTEGELHAYTKNNDDDAVDTTLQNGRLDIGDVTIIGSNSLFKYGDNENSNWLNSGIYTPRVYLQSVTDTPSGLGMYGLAISDSFYIANAVYDDIVRSDMFTSKKSYFYFDSSSGQVWLHPKTNLMLSDSYWGDRRFIFNALRIQFTTDDDEAQIKTAFMSAGAGATVAGSGGYIIITPKQTFPSTPIVVVNQCSLKAKELTDNKLTIGHIINTTDEKEKIQISTSGRKANTTYYLEVFIYCS